MLELIAQGETADARWRRSLPEFAVELGRATESYRVPWDPQISRRHVRLKALEHHLVVKRLESAANPLFFNGERVDECVVHPGEHFVIGNTTFLVTADQAFGSLKVPDPISQRTLSSEFLQQVNYRDADRRLAVLNQIPSVIANADDAQELMIRMVNLLMSGIINATTIGIVRWNPISANLTPSTSTESFQAEPATAAEPDASSPTVSFLNTVGHDSPAPPSGEPLAVIHWDRRGFERGDFQPSEKLVAHSIELGQSVLNVWNADVFQEAPELDENFTFDYENDWAFSCPMESDATRSWAIYVAGKNQIDLAGPDLENPESGSSADLDLEGDIKFCELVGSTLKNLLQVKRLERQQASLRSFFSPIVVDALRGRDPDQVLIPRKCDVSVLFCDLRGFAKTSEQLSHNLLELLERVSDSLQVMTGAILQTGGVIGDFHGDAVMGFWGWPLEDRSLEDNALAAVTAAKLIEAAFADQLHQHPRLRDFQVGLGIASGSAVAGKIGTSDQVKVTVFGPVVNLASRLEGMTRELHSRLLIDRPTAQRLQTADPSILLRRLGTFLPFGLRQSVDVYQVLGEGVLKPADVTTSRQALESFEQGHWDACGAFLKTLPSDDALRRILEAEISSEMPLSFDGIIRMRSKR